MSCANHVYKLRQIWSKIHETICSKGMPLPADFKFVASMHREIDAWYKNTLEQYYAGFGGRLSVFSSKEWFTIAYNHTILAINRRHMIISSKGSATQYLGDQSARQAVTNAFLTSLTAAREICLLYRQLYISCLVTYTWGSLHMLFLAGLTYLHTLWTSSDVRRTTRRDDVYATCTACTMVLVIMAER